MSLTASTMMDLGTVAPAFSLPDVRTGAIVSPALTGRPLLVMFICKHCPFVVHVREELARLGQDYAGKADIVAISSNDAANYAQDSPENLKKMADELGFTFPVCYDETQAVAQEFTAACTPDFFLFDKDHKLAYRGQLDGSRPSNQVPVDGRDLRAAVDALLSGQAPNATQYPSVGCNIKWKVGQQPHYFASALVKK
ncbi:MAG: thioredoxin family protein [Acidobacteriota bacterium]